MTCSVVPRPESCEANSRCCFAFRIFKGVMQGVSDELWVNVSAHVHCEAKDHLRLSFHAWRRRSLQCSSRGKLASDFLFLVLCCACTPKHDLAMRLLCPPGQRRCSAPGRNRTKHQTHQAVRGSPLRQKARRSMASLRVKRRSMNRQRTRARLQGWRRRRRRSERDKSMEKPSVQAATQTMNVDLTPLKSNAMTKSAPDNIHFTLHHLVPQACCVETANVALTRPAITAMTSKPAAQQRAQECAAKKSATRSQLEKDALTLAAMLAATLPNRTQNAKRSIPACACELWYSMTVVFRADAITVFECHTHVSIPKQNVVGVASIPQRRKNNISPFNIICVTSCSVDFLARRLVPCASQSNTIDHRLVFFEC